MALAGLRTYVFSLWNAGITQGLMWRIYNDTGTLHHSFIESMDAMRPYYIGRVFGGTLFLAGLCVGAVNIWLSIRNAQALVPDRPLTTQGSGVAPRPRLKSTISLKRTRSAL
jgi:cytochrome c oxidase cbb3-type subunit 1